MFIVKPIADRALQKQICDSLSAAYRPDTLAYFAANLAEDKETVTDLIGVCQFTVGDVGKIVTLVSAPAAAEDEAMIVLCRAVMAFMHRAGIRTAQLLPDAGPEALLTKMGFPKKDGIYTIDLEAFYKAPCKYTPE